MEAASLLLCSTPALQGVSAPHVAGQALKKLEITAVEEEGLRMSLQEELSFQKQLALRLFSSWEHPWIGLSTFFVHVTLV